MQNSGEAGQEGAEGDGRGERGEGRGERVPTGSPAQPQRLQGPPSPARGSAVSPHSPKTDTHIHTTSQITYTHTLT